MCYQQSGKLVKTDCTAVEQFYTYDVFTTVIRTKYTDYVRGERDQKLHSLYKHTQTVVVE